LSTREGGKDSKRRTPSSGKNRTPFAVYESWRLGLGGIGKIKKADWGGSGPLRGKREEADYVQRTEYEKRPEKPAGGGGLQRGVETLHPGQGRR